MPCCSLREGIGVASTNILDREAAKFRPQVEAAGGRLGRTNSSDNPKASGDGGVCGDNRINTSISAVPTTEIESGVGGDSAFRTTDKGVFYGDGDDELWICSPLDVVAQTRDAYGESWGRLLEWMDPDDTVHRWACPARMLAGDGQEFRAVLLDAGLRIAPSAKARALLATYVQTAKIDARATCTNRAGWHGGSFVLPRETIGTDHVLLQTAGEPPRLDSAGTLADWQPGIAARCVGNSRLLLAVSAAFAAPLLYLIGAESGGVHLVGPSSCGKTTALRAAASVWGGPAYLQRWRATDNGLEAVAQAHNDLLLVLDELGQVDARHAGEIAYMLANGTGKHRAKRDGLAKPAARWRLLFLSAGEIGLGEHMREGGKRARAGQETRMADVPADASHGLFDELHGLPSGAALADVINRAAREHYGTAGREYLKALVAADQDTVRAGIKAIAADFAREHLPAGADGQAGRVAERFALIAAGGELASSLGVTGWPAGEAVRGLGVCFRAWLERRGGAGSREDAEALAQVRHFIEAHGEARFTDLAATHDRPTINRAGYRRRIDGRVEHLILTEVFRREVCAGLDHRRVAQVLRDGGLLKTEGRHMTIKVRGIGRVYCLTGSDDEE